MIATKGARRRMQQIRNRLKSLLLSLELLCHEGDGAKLEANHVVLMNEKLSGLRKVIAWNSQHFTVY
jgi:hypothetical protein